jgi:hypothetical protein
MKSIFLCFHLAFLLLLMVCAAVPTFCSESLLLDQYQQLKAFQLDGRAAKLENLQVKRDRIDITLTGTVYLAKPIAGSVCGAVFIGVGRVRSEPSMPFERESIKRFLKKEVIDENFTKAVFRFTDDTGALLAGNPVSQVVVPADAQKLASELEQHLLHETGLNLSARLLLSISGNESPGFFFAEFDGGDRDRFACLLDYQARVPSSIFGINGGEKGLFFKYQDEVKGYDVWTAFYDQEEMKRGIVAYSDTFDIVSVSTHRMEIDLTKPGSRVRMDSELEMSALTDSVQVIPLQLNEGLSTYENERQRKGLRVLNAALKDGTAVEVIQDPQETGFSLLLPQALRRDKQTIIKIKLEGIDSLWTWGHGYHFPRSSTTWYPRYGYLARSLYDMTFRHNKRDRVASVGERVREGPSEDNKEEWITQWVAKEPLALATFVCGRFERHEEMTEVEGKKLPIEYYSVPGDIQAVKEDFIMAEIGNGLRFFASTFGPYPYGRLAAAYFPTQYGQGFPTLLLLPVEGYARIHEFALIAHEASHQWWGNIVGWRSYRDQWLSEGFAEYSGVLYTGFRMKGKSVRDLIKEMRDSLLSPPETDAGIAGGKLYEVGPLILGQRLSSRRSQGAYEALIYNKGALVLRMLHFLFTNPGTGDGQAFFDMMKDFVNRYRNFSASTEQFAQVAGEHFARSPIARKYGIKDLNWFFSQWVWQTALPTYRLEYSIVDQPGGKALLKGMVFQENAPDNWAMPLPVVLKFGENQFASGTILARGPQQPVSIELFNKPQSVELDPGLWVLSEKTSTRKQ